MSQTFPKHVLFMNLYAKNVFGIRCILCSRIAVGQWRQTICSCWVSAFSFCTSFVLFVSVVQCCSTKIVYKRESSTGCLHTKSLNLDSLYLLDIFAHFALYTVAERCNSRVTWLKKNACWLLKQRVVTAFTWKCSKCTQIETKPESVDARDLH